MENKEDRMQLWGMTVTLTYQPFDKISQPGQIELRIPKSIGIVNGVFFLGCGY
jgi:hypothetical protein